MDTELDHLSIKIDVDKEEVFNDNLNFTSIASKYRSIIVETNNGKHILQITIEDNNFEFLFEYPKDKHIIVSPN